MLVMLEDVSIRDGELVGVIANKGPRAVRDVHVALLTRGGASAVEAAPRFQRLLNLPILLPPRQRQLFHYRVSSESPPVSSMDACIVSFMDA